MTDKIYFVMVTRFVSNGEYNVFQSKGIHCSNTMKHQKQSSLCVYEFHNNYFSHMIHPATKMAIHIEFCAFKCNYLHCNLHGNATACL